MTGGEFATREDAKAFARGTGLVHGVRGGKGAMTEKRKQRCFQKIVTASLLTLSGGDRDEGAKLLDSLNSRKGSLARFDITDAAAPPPAWLMALRLQYHTALELGDAHHAITILSSISHANAAHDRTAKLDDEVLRAFLSTLTNSRPRPGSTRTLSSAHTHSRVAPLP